MKKYIIKFSTFLIISINLFSKEAVITSLEVPLYKKNSTESVVVEWKRKGEKIYIHNSNFEKSPFEVDYNLDRDNSYIPKERNQGLYQTLDSSGNIAFVPKQFVKVIFNDSREFDNDITKEGKDPLDYRLEEPLPKHYPFKSPGSFRIQAALGMGPSLKDNYNYSSEIKSEDFSNKRGFQIFAAKNITFDMNDRLYFGFMGHIYNHKNSFATNDIEATEVHNDLGIGPFISYDPYRSKKVLLTILLGATLNYHRTLVGISDQNGQNEERFFKGNSITPKFALNINKRNFIGNADLFFGMEARLNYIYSQVADNPSEIQSLWSDESDSIDHDINAITNFTIGLQAHF